VIPSYHRAISESGVALGSVALTTRVVEVPGAISQGRDEDEACRNVLVALYDLSHVLSPAERIGFTLQARVIQPLLGLLRLH
jgi:hypothetical protein